MSAIARALFRLVLRCFPQKFAETHGGEMADAFGTEVERHRQPLLQLLRDEMPRLGCQCATPPGTTSPIITFTMADGDRVRERFRRANIDVRVARNFVRFSPSVYNDLDDVESVLEALS